MKVIVATKNQGKVRDFATFFQELGWQWEALPPSAPSVVEDGLTFEDNAMKKAQAYFDGEHAVLADDSGLEVDALGGAPGLFSARYAGENASDAENNQKLLTELLYVPMSKRRARFVCTLVLLRPNQAPLIVNGTVNGVILPEARGVGGFGYDPLFLPDGEERTMAELSAARKNEISHRGRAMTQLLDHL